MNRIEILWLGKPLPVTLMLADDNQAAHIFDELVEAVRIERGAVYFEIEGEKIVIECKQIIGVSFMPSAIYDAEARRAEDKARAEANVLTGMTMCEGVGYANIAQAVPKRNSVFGYR